MSIRCCEEFYDYLNDSEVRSFPRTLGRSRSWYGNIGLFPRDLEGAYIASYLEAISSLRAARIVISDVGNCVLHVDVYGEVWTDSFSFRLVDDAWRDDDRVRESLVAWGFTVNDGTSRIAINRNVLLSKHSMLMVRESLGVRSMFDTSKSALVTRELTRVLGGRN